MPTADPEQICLLCRHWRATANYAVDSARLGQCRRNAPAVFFDHKSGKMLTRFPLIREDDDCGEFKPKTENQKKAEALT